MLSDSMQLVAAGTAVVGAIIAAVSAALTTRHQVRAQRSEAAREARREQLIASVSRNLTILAETPGRSGADEDFQRLLKELEPAIAEAFADVQEQARSLEGVMGAVAESLDRISQVQNKMSLILDRLNKLARSPRPDPTAVETGMTLLQDSIRELTSIRGQISSLHMPGHH